MMCICSFLVNLHLYRNCLKEIFRKKRSLEKKTIKKHCEDVSFRSLKISCYRSLILNISKMSLSCIWTVLHKKKAFSRYLNTIRIKVTSWWHLQDLLLQHIKRHSYREIGLDILDIQFCLWIVLLMQRIFNISKRHLQKLALAKQKEI